MSESRQHWLDRNRPPRVQITYDVETLGATVKQEIPFVVGVMGDFTGSTTPPLGLADRRFVEIDRDNFDQVMESLGATIDLSANPKKLASVARKADGTPGYDVNAAARTNVPVRLDIRSLDDFGPRRILEQLGQANPQGDLALMLQARQYLSELLVKIQGNVWTRDKVLPAVTSALKAANDHIPNVKTAFKAFAADASGPGTFNKFAEADKQAVSDAIDAANKAVDTAKTGFAAVYPAVPTPLLSDGVPAAVTAKTALAGARDKYKDALTKVKDAASRIAGANPGETATLQATAAPLVKATEAAVTRLDELATTASAVTDLAGKYFPAPPPQ
ncbi:MAG TPA: type VI secretion system contractile sheath small subunit [Longimicrobium sp.]|nr:type VI secretion system contractile sheath small subunit [Longimicrobium sp.]